MAYFGEKTAMLRDWMTYGGRVDNSPTEQAFMVLSGGKPLEMFLADHAYLHDIIPMVAVALDAPAECVDVLSKA